MRKVAFDDIELIKVIATPEVEVAKTLGKGYYFTPLPYWHEETDYTWVKIDLSIGTNVVYVYYGSPTATDESNGNAVFEFFDDFEDGVIDPTKWTIDGGSWSESGGVLHKTNTDSEGWLRTNNDYDNGILESKTYLPSDAGDDDMRLLARYQSTSQHYNLHAGWSGYIRLAKDGTSVVLDEHPHTPSYSVWYKMKFLFDGSTLKGKIWQWGTPEPDWQVTATDSTYSSGKIALATWNNKVDFDDVFVRKYSSSPPSISYSSEESGSWTIDGHTFTKRKKVTITSSQALSGYQVQLDYSQWNENNIRVLRKVWIE